MDAMGCGLGRVIDHEAWSHQIQVTYGDDMCGDRAVLRSCVWLALTWVGLGMGAL